jgi:hypothetical protein
MTINDAGESRLMLDGGEPRKDRDPSGPDVDVMVAIENLCPRYFETLSLRRSAP